MREALESLQCLMQTQGGLEADLIATKQCIEVY